MERKTIGGKIPKNFNNRGDYRPGSISGRIPVKAPEPPKINKKFKDIICNCIDNALKKGETLEESISAIAKSGRIQDRLIDYYFFMQDIGNKMEFYDIVKRIYNEREIEKKLSEKNDGNNR